MSAPQSVSAQSVSAQSVPAQSVPARSGSPRSVASRHVEVDAVLADLRGVARRERLRARLGHATLVATLIVLLVLTVTRAGSVRVPFVDALVAAVGQGSGLADFVVWETLAPRAAVATLAGGLLGVSGVIFQRLVGNVLATPDIIGVTAGASAGGVLVLVSIGRSGAPVQVGALVGAAVAVLAILALASGRGAVTQRIVLVGIGISAVFFSVTNYVLAQADEGGTQRALRWLVGTLNGAGWADVGVLGATAALGVVVMVLVGRDLDALRLGEDVAAGLGARVRRTRVVVLLAGAAMAAMASSVVGPVAFVALVSGPIAGRLPGGGGVAAAGLVGAIVLVGSDLVAQSAPLVSPVPTGAVTALVGAPVLMVLLLRRRAAA